MSKIKIFSLGGLNENGKNMYVVDVDNAIFVFDAGLKYGNDNLLGIDYVIPNFDYIISNKERVKGIFLTHGHDSNMGAIADILTAIPDINVYATKFTMEFVKRDLKEANVEAHNLKEIRPHAKINFDDLTIFPISVSHSIPDAVAYVLYTKDGAIVYTGDFVFDAAAPINYKMDIGKLAYVGKQGVLCLLTESIYAGNEGHTSPHNRANKYINNILKKYKDRIIITIFEAHIYRIQELFDEIAKTKRKVVIMGKLFQETINKAIDMKYLNFDKNQIGDLSNLNDRDVIIFVSDEKEKPFANIERIIKGYDRYIKLKENDMVFISEPSYEGSEKIRASIMDEIAKQGVHVESLSHKTTLLHHASSEDLMLMINLMNPKYYFPVRGEYRHQYMNAQLAEQVGIPKNNIILKLNGEVATFIDGVLTDDKETIEIDDILIDGKSQGDIGGLVIKDRQMLGESGIVVVTTTLSYESKKILIGPELITRGFVFVKDNAELLEKGKKICLDIITELISSDIKKVDYTKIRNEIREKLGKYFYKETECRPVIITVINEI
ncbi:MAG: ribonuclease J [Tenericutes bacterium]|jgi:ribonuclease J|nr:ribonuclease J [Mycoplasmatota bacterium]